MLIAAVHGDTIEFPVMMAAYYGLRRSEIAGLRWKAIDFKSNRITIEHTVTQAIVDGERKIFCFFLRGLRSEQGVNVFPCGRKRRHTDG